MRGWYAISSFFRPSKRRSCPPTPSAFWGRAGPLTRTSKPEPVDRGFSVHGLNPLEKLVRFGLRTIAHQNRILLICLVAVCRPPGYARLGEGSPVDGAASKRDGSRPSSNATTKKD